MATEKTTRLEALVFARFGPFPAVEADGSTQPEWVQVCGHLRWLLQNATPETEDYAIGFASGPLFGWGLSTLAEIQAALDGAPFVVAPGEAEAARAPGPRPRTPDAERLDGALETFREEVEGALRPGG